MNGQSKLLSFDRVIAVLNFAIPVVLYILVLVIQIPYSLSRLVSFYSIPLFLLVLVLYYAIFRLPGNLRWMAGASLTLILLGLQLSFLWSSGYSIDKIIGGLLPFRDAFDYYHGAKLISIGQPIANDINSASWRPLFAGFLAAVLFLTQQNFQWALAIITALAGSCYFLSAHYVQKSIGSPAAAFYMALTLFYIQPLMGTAYTEQLGLAFGCLGFILLWVATRTQRVRDLTAGLVVLMLAISTRAGAFFIFPVLILWAGWAFRGKRRFSLKYAGISAITILVAYLVVNTLYNRLVVQPGGVLFGNFAFTLYGQVVGGAGYNWAIRTLGSRNPIVVYRAAGQYFLAHPLSFFIGAAKAYRDFFLPQMGIFSFQPSGQLNWLDYLLWAAETLLLLWGLIRSLKSIGDPASSLLVAGFAGIFISIPFLPPIDGGIRIYASSMPFVYALPAMAAAEILSPRRRLEEDALRLLNPALGLSILLSALTVVVPILILYLNKPPMVNTPVCPGDQVSFAATIDPGSYIDLVPDNGTSCGRAPEVCLRDFNANMGTHDPSDREVLQYFLAPASLNRTRVFPASDLLNGGFYFFVGPSEDFQGASSGGYVLTGCATKVLVPKRQGIYQIQSINNAVNASGATP